MEIGSSPRDQVVPAAPFALDEDARRGDSPGWGAETSASSPPHVLAGASRQSAPGTTTLLETVRQIEPLDIAAMDAAATRQNTLTKPQGSLGRLEELAIRIAGITKDPRPTLPRKAVIVMAADHGVAAEGVSAYPQAVTAQMVNNFLSGGAAVNVLARRAGARVVVVDMGVAADLPVRPDLRIEKIGRGTQNFVTGPAMAYEDAIRAIATGIAVLNDEAEAGLDLVATGDMGIGNTTASSAIVAAITGARPADITGRGTGIDDDALARKVAMIEHALQVNQPDASDPLDVLAKVGGFEIAGLVGVMLCAAARRVPVILDGFISGAAALIACELCPQVRDYLIPAHTSVEIGHRVILERMEWTSILNLNLRLGEGTGAVMAMHLVDDALAILGEMATFAEAGVSGRDSAERPEIAASETAGVTPPTP